MPSPLPAQYFFKTYPDQGKVKSGRRPTLINLQGEIGLINRRVNNAIKPRKDKSDGWDIYPKEGDCDDYVVTKRAELLKAGYGSQYLLIALCKLPSGENHAVLIVRSEIGDYVLDNLSGNSMWPKDKVKYQWLLIQNPANPHAFDNA